MAKRSPDRTQALDLTLPRSVAANGELMLRELNARLEQISSLISTLGGVGDRTPVIKNHVDLSGKRVTNAQDAQSDTDYITRKEAKKNSGYKQNGLHKFGDIEVENITVLGTFRGSRIRSRPGGGSNPGTGGGGGGGSGTGGYPLALGHARI